MSIIEMTVGLFDRKYEDIQKVIPFNPEWKNSTGYLDGAVEGPSMVQLEPGEEAKSYEEASDRKMIFIGTFLGPIVIFARYKAAQNGIYVHNSASLLRSSGIIPSSQLGYDNLNFVFTGGHNGEPYNIEGYLRHLKEVLTYQEQPKATTEQITEVLKLYSDIGEAVLDSLGNVGPEDDKVLHDIATRVAAASQSPGLMERLSAKKFTEIERRIKSLESELATIEAMVKTDKPRYIMSLLRRIALEGSKLVEWVDKGMGESIQMMVDSSLDRINAESHIDYLATLPASELDLDIERQLKALKTIRRLSIPKQ
jgi:hypothetical protein